jgi:hypothetical protein
VRPAFDMTMNKSQGQTLRVMGLFLFAPVFGHGQRYVANSRVGSRSCLNIMVVDGIGNGFPRVYTKNVVHREALLASAGVLYTFCWQLQEGRQSRRQKYGTEWIVK